ncbi:MAG: hypothetical protein HS111_39520 [Kofleriaceae bacterium]|nr:hypothetical protein [Kofleriaceae bacterium]MCL4227411.1 hypothetical protein [Myxococcales bacterium]
MRPPTSPPAAPTPRPSTRPATPPLTRPRPLARGAALGVLALAACGGGDGGDPDAPGAGDAGPDGGGARDRVGVIEVIEDRWVFPADSGGGESRTGQVRARFFQGREPRFHREVMRAGACALRTHEVVQCTPACTDGLCVGDDVCEPWPTYVSAGRLTLTGLTTPIQIDPQDNLYYPDGVLPPELFADGATVTATLAGATLPAMTLTAGGVPAITPDITGGELVVPYPAVGDAVVRWTPAGGDARVRLTLNANNRGHGMPFIAIIECDVVDADGQIAVAPALLDAFPETDAWFICAGTDCPPSSLVRYRRAAVAVGEQEVELVVGNAFTFGIEHDLP